MTKEKVIRNLKYTKEKHKDDRVYTCGTDIALMCEDVLNVLDNCIEIPNNATNGDVIKALFPNFTFNEEWKANRHFELYSEDYHVKITGTATSDWWNAPYKEK